MPQSPFFSEIRRKLDHSHEGINLGFDKVSGEHPTYFIAEIGNNHNGDFFLAKRTIEEAAKSGANAVKFQKRFINQTFAKELRDKPITRGEIKGRTYGEYRSGLEFSLEEFIELKHHAEFNKVAFFATPFDKQSVDFLEKVDIPFYKISSFDVTNLPLIDYIAKLNKPIILSTGMATLEEVDEAVLTILKHHDQLAILHCVSIYPSPDKDINMDVVQLLKKRYHPLVVGYSGHEKDYLPSLISVAKGALIIERHLTLSRLLPGPDHSTVSIDPKTFKEMVDGASRVRSLCGVAKKKIKEQEKVTRDKHGKSIVAKITIPKGSIIKKSMLTFKSPGYGIKPGEIKDIIGRRVISKVEEDQVITRENLEK